MSQSLVWYTGQYGTDPNDLINAKGPLSLDKRWLFKFSFGYNFPWDILFSFNYLFQSGRPTLKFVRIRGLNQPYSVRIKAFSKGEQRFDSQHLLNLRIEKAFNFAKKARLSSFVDIFNLLNDDTVTRYRSYNVWSSSFKEPMWIPYPRRAQVGIKFEF